MTDDNSFRRPIDVIRAGEPTVKGRVYSEEIMRGIAARAKWLMVLQKTVVVEDESLALAICRAAVTVVEEAS